MNLISFCHKIKQKKKLCGEDQSFIINKLLFEKKQGLNKILKS